MFKEKAPLFLPNFILKIVALLTMTLDHVGYMLQDYGICLQLAEVFRIVGRFALPLFCFMIVEGVLHTRNFGKYALRLGICLVAVSISLAVVEYAPMFNVFTVRDEGNIFIDLLLGATAVYCLKDKRWWVKLLSFLPLMYAVGSSIAQGYECVACGTEVWIIPFFLRTQYGWYGVLLILGFYGAYLLSQLFIHSYAEGLYRDTKYERIAANLLSILALGIVNLILFIIWRYELVPQQYLRLDVQSEMFSLIAGVFILLYNGKRGYNANWFKYGCYVYYALHMIIIYGIFALVG